MSILVGGDPHVKFDTLIESREMCCRFVQLAQELKSQGKLLFTVILGDTLDKFGDAKVDALDVCIEDLFGPLHELAPLFVLIGNHDMSNASMSPHTKHPFGALKRWKNTTVCDRPLMAEIAGMKYTFCPYLPDGILVETLNKYLQDEWKQSTIVFCHQTLYQAKFGLRESKTGDKWDPSFPFCAIGHVHDYHQLYPNALYIGTMMSLTHGDNARKTVSILTPSPSPPLSSPSPPLLPPASVVFDTKFPHDLPHIVYQSNEVMIYETRVELSLPKPLHVKILANEVLTYTPQQYSRLKITIIGTNAEVASVKKLQIVKEWKSKGIVVVYDYVKQQIKIVNASAKDTSLSFKDRVYREIKEDPQLLELFNEIHNITPGKI